jgi:hypothetical protein
MSPDWRQVIGVSQVLGAAAGIVGLRFGAALIPASVATAPLVVASSYFLLALAAGLLLLWRRPLGVPLSLAVQAPQVLSVIVGGQGLHFLAGPFAGFAVGGTGLRLSLAGGGLAIATAFTGAPPWMPGTHLDFGIAYRTDNPEALTFGVNVFAILACAQLWRAWDTSPPAALAPPGTTLDVPPTGAG